jgi:pimeloyl-ACP methyl ester carboxylesterase
MNNPLTDTDPVTISQNSQENHLVANKLRLCYDEFGDKTHPPIVLIMGLGTQMIAWSVEFCQGLADSGFRVIRFDNRDIGLSEKIRVKNPVSVMSVFLRSKVGLPFDVPYTLNDMAADTIGVLDALGITAAHVVGASMGGMISQIVAAQYPERCLSLTSIMSTTGNPALPTANWRVTKQLVSRPTSGSEAELLEHGLKTWAIIGSPDFPPSKEELTEKILASMRRSSYPAGFRNQMAAIAHSGDRRSILSNITAPTLIIHGKADVLVPAEGGIDTAKHIKGSKLRLLEGMGHDIPKELRPRIIRMIAEHASQA